MQRALEFLAEGQNAAGNAHGGGGQANAQAGDEMQIAKE
jgi:hypothetical protein